ncbi:alanine dehydrogenase [bacterium]|nr:MAG: alanine dehydrogenase [bacterium]
MEIINPSNIAIDFGLKTLEKRLSKTNSQISLKIGVPREQAANEHRLSITPSGATILTANGHEVYVEQGAGKQANYSDQDYADAGAHIVYSTEELYKKSELISKVAPPNAEETKLLQRNQILLSALHLGNQKVDFFDYLISQQITGIGFEFIQDASHTFPIVRMMHEITGLLSIQIATHYLETRQQGQGILLGGISGIPPAVVVILGAGIIAEYAARTALGYGAQVFVLDNDLAQLRHLENTLDRRVITAVANPSYISSAIKQADVVIGAVMEEGHRAPCWVTADMVSQMKPGTVIVDTVIDQGGCIETSRQTTIAKPTYTEYGITHYCVPNIPSTVARTSTVALNNVIVPFLIDIGDQGGIEQALWNNVALRNGTYSYRKHITKKSLSEMFDRPYREIDMLIASAF